MMEVQRVLGDADELPQSGNSIGGLCGRFPSERGEAMVGERQVRMAARLYEMRDTARSLLGDKYADKMAELGSALRQVADLTQRDPLSVAIEAARNTDGLAQCYVLAAAVELAEPSNTRDQHIRDAGATLRPSGENLPSEE